MIQQLSKFFCVTSVVKHVLRFFCFVLFEMSGGAFSGSMLTGKHHGCWWDSSSVSSPVRTPSGIIMPSGFRNAWQDDTQCTNEEYQKVTANRKCTFVVGSLWVV